MKKLTLILLILLSCGVKEASPDIKSQSINKYREIDRKFNYIIREYCIDGYSYTLVKSSEGISIIQNYVTQSNTYIPQPKRCLQ